MKKNTYVGNTSDANESSKRVERTQINSLLYRSHSRLYTFYFYTFDDSDEELMSATFCTTNDMTELRYVHARELSKGTEANLKELQSYKSYQNEKTRLTDFFI